MTTAALDRERGATVAGHADNARPRRCKLGRLLDDESTEGRELIAAAIAAPYWTDRALAHRLALTGRSVSASLISIHRNGLCICTPESETR